MENDTLETKKKKKKKNFFFTLIVAVMNNKCFKSNYLNYFPAYSFFHFSKHYS